MKDPLELEFEMLKKQTPQQKEYASLEFEIKQLQELDPLRSSKQVQGEIFRLSVKKCFTGVCDCGGCTKERYKKQEQNA